MAHMTPPSTKAPDSTSCRKGHSWCGGFYRAPCPIRVGGQLPPCKRWLDTTVLPNSTCDPWCAGVSCVHTTCKTFLKWIELVVQTGLSKRRNCWLYRNVIPCGCEGTPKISAKYVCLSVRERLFPSLMSSQMWEKTCRQCTAMLP